MAHIEKMFMQSEQRGNVIAPSVREAGNDICSCVNQLGIDVNLFISYR